MGFRFMAPDHYSYASFAAQAAEEGKFFLENRFTTEPQKGRFLILYMWLVGQVSRLTDWGIPASWYFVGFFAGVGFMLAAWRFAGLLFNDMRSRLLAYLFVAFSGGVGWVHFFITVQSQRGLSGGYLKDPFNYQWNWSTFGSMLTPLWVTPAALFLVCACLIVGNNRRFLRLLLGVILPPLIWFIHPYTGIAAYFTFVLYPLVPVAGAMWRLEAIPWGSVRERFKAVLPLLLSFAIVVAYLFWSQQDTVYSINSKCVFSWTPSYSVFLYPFAYGLLLPLAVYGLRWSALLGTRARDMLIAWFVASVTLAVNPFLFGAKFQYLVHLPLAIFAAHGLLELRRRSEYVRNLLKGVGAFVIGVFLFLNSAIVIFKDFPRTASDPNIYLSASELGAMDVLKRQSPGNVLSSVRTGNRIPWLTAKKAYVGHWFLTIHQERKIDEVAAFFGPQLSTEEKRSWLAKQQIRYIYYGPAERAAGSIDPSLGLSTIYDQDGVAIYAVP